MSQEQETFRFHVPRILLLGSGFVFLLFFLLYNEFLLSLFHPMAPFGDITVRTIRLAQLSFLFFGAFAVSLAECIRRIAWLGRFAAKPVVTNLLLSFLVVFMPISILELSLSSFAWPMTEIFIEDRELGWRLKPDSEGVWGGATVKINGKGLRGPELEYANPANAYRILYLGDSVTFGFRLESWKQAFPYVVEEILEERVGSEIETINAGVGGYSPWQFRGFLRREGIKYEPDLVVVAFVLNDVVEKAGLVRFGGKGRGWQLLQATSLTLDEWFYKSAIVRYLRGMRAYFREAKDLQRQAVQEELLNVESLAYEPDRPGLEKLWEITLDNLRDMVVFCRDRDISVVFVVFPFTFQFEDVDALSAPQDRVKAFTTSQGIPAVDLLPILAARLEQEGLNPDDYFLDFDHLSPLGSEVVSKIIADFLIEEGLVTQPGGTTGEAGKGCR